MVWGSRKKDMAANVVQLFADNTGRLQMYNFATHITFSASEIQYRARQKRFFLGCVIPLWAQWGKMQPSRLPRKRLKWLGFAKSEFMNYIMQNFISSLIGTLFLLTSGPIMEKFKIFYGIFQIGIHQVQVLQASQAGRESTQWTMISAVVCKMACKKV